MHHFQYYTKNFKFPVELFWSEHQYILISSASLDNNAFTKSQKSNHADISFNIIFPIIIFQSHCLELGQKLNLIS